MALPQTKPVHTKIKGGLDIVTPPVDIHPGKATLAMNYTAGDHGGLQLLDGMERFSGQPAPSDADYSYCGFTFTDTVSVGDLLTGAVTGATGEVIEVTATYVVITKVTLTFNFDEDCTVAGAPVGSIVGHAESRGHLSSLADATALNLAADVYRADISAPPGSGPVRGGGKLNSVVYVFRDNVGATSCDLWASSAAGWVQVAYLTEISFDTGVGTISDGDTVTQLVSGATGVVERAILESGAWAGTAVGRLILSGITGTFDATNALQVGAVTQATSTSLATAITQLPGGRYYTKNYNFGGAVDTFRMYGVDGVNRGFEFDGSIFAPISTGMTVDTPDKIMCHKLQLFFSYGASLQNSSITTPFAWNIITGANEIGMGDTITNLVELPGDALGVIGERGSYQLLGYSVADFVLDTIASDVGGYADSVQNIGTTTLMVGKHGLTRIETSDKQGNFDNNTVSRLVQPLFDKMGTDIVGSSVNRGLNQYRVYSSDGSGMICTLASTNVNQGIEAGFFFTQMQYPINIDNVMTFDDDTTYICDDSGNIYQADKGTSFDGEDKEAWFRLAYNNYKTPTVEKSFLKAVFELTAQGYSSIRIHPDFTYADSFFAQHILQDFEVHALGALWNVDDWNLYYWDSKVVASPRMRIGGHGENMTMIVYVNSQIDQGHKIDGIVTHIIPRKVNR